MSSSSRRLKRQRAKQKERQKATSQPTSRLESNTTGSSSLFDPGQQNNVERTQCKTDPLVYTVHELAAALKVSRTTVDRLVARGILPGKAMIGGQVRFVRQMIDQWLLEQTEVVKDGNRRSYARQEGINSNPQRRH